MDAEILFIALAVALAVSVALNIYLLLPKAVPSTTKTNEVRQGSGVLSSVESNATHIRYVKGLDFWIKK
jgi:hypothetical protein